MLSYCSSKWLPRPSRKPSRQMSNRLFERGLRLGSGGWRGRSAKAWPVRLTDSDHPPTSSPRVRCKKIGGSLTHEGTVRLMAGAWEACLESQRHQHSLIFQMRNREALGSVDEGDAPPARHVIDDDPAKPFRLECEANRLAFRYCQRTAFSSRATVTPRERSIFEHHGAVNSSRNIAMPTGTCWYEVRLC